MKGQPLKSRFAHKLIYVVEQAIADCGQDTYS